MRRPRAFDTTLKALQEKAKQLQGNTNTSPADLKTRWRRAGLRSFDPDKENT